MEDYKKFLTLIPDDAPPTQRKVFESKMQQYLNEGIKQLELKKIII